MYKRLNMVKRRSVQNILAYLTRNYASFPISKVQQDDKIFRIRGVIDEVMLYKSRCPYSSMSKTSNEIRLVAPEESKRFMKDCFTAVHVPQKHAEEMADLLVAADIRGHFSHGMNRLEMYINDLLQKTTDGEATPIVLQETPATAWVDGRNGLGAVVGNFCMELAIQKAKNVGVGWVCSKRSNHYGIAGWYSMKAMTEGLIGISMTNTSPLMTPTRAKEAALGTNPIAFGAVAENDEFLLDMATTAVAVGKIEIQRRKGEEIPSGWAQNKSGKITTDANEAFESGCLMPLGGPEISSGYKGYGLGAVVDILTGVMSGAKYSRYIRNWSHSGAASEANLGQVFISVDPNCFAPDFSKRLADFNKILRTTMPIDEKLPVLVPGDKENDEMRIIQKTGGIQYIENQIDSCRNLAQRLDVKPIQFLNAESIK